MFYIRPTLGLADSTSGGVLVVSNTETEKNRNRVLELKTEPNRTGSSNLGTEPALTSICLSQLWTALYLNGIDIIKWFYCLVFCEV